jgi:diguanylate cyclase (GGDEF)-like protein/PAS domain S-box-containing protein
MTSPAGVTPRRSGQYPATPNLTPPRGESEIPLSVFSRKGKTVLLVGMVLYTAATTAWLAFGAPGGDSAGAMSVLLPALVTSFAVLMTFRAAETPLIDAGTRRFWRLVGISQLMPLLSEIEGVTGSPFVGMPLSGLSLGTAEASAVLATAFPLIGQVVLLYALLQLPSAPRGRGDRVRLWLDSATVLVGGLLVAWYNMFAATSAPDFSRTLLAMRHLQGIGDLVLLLVISMLWRRTLLQHRATVLEILAASLLVHFLGHVATVADVMRGETATVWINILSPVAALCVAASAWFKSVSWQHRGVRPGSVSPRAAMTVSIMTCAAVLPGFALLLKAARDQGTEPLAGLVIGAVALTALGFARQVASTRETVRLTTESTVRNNEARFRALVQHSSDVITILDADGTIRYASPSVWTVLGHDPQSLVGTRLTALLHEEDVDFGVNFLAELARATPLRGASTPGALKREWRIAHANGSWMTVDNVGTNLLAEPVIEGLVLNTRDVTEQAVIKQQYMHQAFHDPLTDLANRSLFLYQVGHALARASRVNSPVTVLFLDLDNFKNVNDSLGHAAGDRLLVEAARRLAMSVREMDLIARLGGDEFAVLVENTADIGEVIAVADRIVASLEKSFNLNGKEVFVSASIGIARTVAGEGSDELVRNADVAMYAAKSRGKGQYVLFESQMHSAALERLVVEADLHRALEHDEFILEYQPIVMLETGEIVGAEALVRWVSRDRGTVAPGVFIPIAEETGLIVQIGRWVLRRACAAAQAWEQERGIPMRITVNLSGRQLQEPCIADDVRFALQESGLRPDRLVLEITESMLMHNTEMSITRLAELKAIGVALAIDDFGTGYSSLSYLQRYPIDILKIDKAFVDAIDKGGEGPVLASAIVALGETLRMNTVAEGIETEAQRRHLISLGCELGQGFLFAPPIDADAFWRLLLTRGSRSYEATRRYRDTKAAAA